MGKQPWYEDFFQEDYLRIYSPFLPAAKSEQEVEEMIRLLKLKPGASILDLCCGTGRHAIPLSLHGYEVTGLDLNQAMLEQAQQNASQQRTSIHWIKRDMRDISFSNTFDAVINVFTSFGYLTEEENQDVLQQIQKALKPGGLFLLETIPQARVVRSTAMHGITKYTDGLIVLEERQMDLLTSRNEVQISLLYPDGKRKEHRQSIRVYTLTELSTMLAQAGLTIKEYYGGLEGNPLSLDSRLVIISQKEHSLDQPD